MENKNKDVYATYSVHTDKFDIEANSRKEAIEKLIDVVNSMQNEYYILIKGFFFCKSERCVNPHYVPPPPDPQTQSLDDESIRPFPDENT